MLDTIALDHACDHPMVANRRFRWSTEKFEYYTQFYFNWPLIVREVRKADGRLRDDRRITRACVEYTICEVQMDILVWEFNAVGSSPHFGL